MVCAIFFLLLLLTLLLLEQSTDRITVWITACVVIATHLAALLLLNLIDSPSFSLCRMKVS